ncbi:MAG: hypothetical protein CL521_00720 [Actinobacteria bacterium]|nr:hypothetical protein [Actinomycetota bacterium]
MNKKLLSRSLSAHGFSTPDSDCSSSESLPGSPAILPDSQQALLFQTPKTGSPTSPVPPVSPVSPPRISVAQLKAKFEGLHCS